MGLLWNFAPQRLSGRARTGAALYEDDNTIVIFASIAAVPNPADWCLFNQWSWDLTCMPRSEWASWVQAGGAMLALAVAIAAPHIYAAFERKRIRLGHLAQIEVDLETAREVAAIYLHSDVRAPAYRLHLQGATSALPALIADLTFSTDEAKELTRWYIDATSFNLCLDLTTELRRDEGAWKKEVSRNELKAMHLVPSSTHALSRYDKAKRIASAVQSRESGGLFPRRYDALKPPSVST